MSIPLLVEVAALTPLTEEPCDKKWVIFNVEWRVHNVE